MDRVDNVTQSLANCSGAARRQLKELSYKAGRVNINKKLAVVNSQTMKISRLK